MMSAALTDSLAALLRGESLPWTRLGTTVDEFLDACTAHGVTGLLYERVRRAPWWVTWPAQVDEALANERRAATARELLCAREITSVLDALAAAGVHPILLKGAALAYTVYDTPASRPRVDTDVLIRRDDVEPLRTVLTSLGYAAPVHCGGELLFCQFPLRRVDRFGVAHVFDVHWKISTQSMFADVLTFDELTASAAPLPALGPHARMTGPVHSLLLACVHPVMHHQNVELLLWVSDVHRLASRLTKAEFDVFAELAVEKRMGAICAHQLELAGKRCGTSVPDAVLRRLRAGSPREACAVYLRPNRRWHHELVSNLRGLPHWGDRLRLLGEVALPHSSYMLKTYNVAPSALGMAAIPFLHAHRLARGVLKVLTGRK
jgi:hypothetical protein